MDDGTTYCYGCLPPSFQSTGWSALFFSAERGNLLTTKSLLKAGANVALKDKVLVECYALMGQGQLHLRVVRWGCIVLYII